MVKQITEHQIRVLELKAAGLTDKAIGDKLGLAHITVACVLSRARFALNAASTPQAVGICYERGLFKGAHNIF